MSDLPEDEVITGHSDDPESWETFCVFLKFISADIGIMRAEGIENPPFTPKEGRAIFLMAAEPHGITVGQLADGLGVSMPRASRLADALVKNGFITRIRSDEDRRELKLQLTPMARDFSLRMWEFRKNAIRATLDQFSREQQIVVIDFLKILTTKYKAVSS